MKTVSPVLRPQPLESLSTQLCNLTQTTEADSRCGSVALSLSTNPTLSSMTCQSHRVEFFLSFSTYMPTRICFASAAEMPNDSRWPLGPFYSQHLLEAL